MKKTSARILSALLVLCLSISMLGMNVSAATTASGTCGSSVEWSLSSDGTLTISGKGEMKYYEDYTETPWYKHRSDITAIVIEDGVTSISSRAFSDTNAVTVKMADSVTTLGYSAFSNCPKLTTVQFSAGLTEVGEFLFDNCGKLTSVEIPDGAETPSMGQCLFMECSGLKDLSWYKYDTIPAHSFELCGFEELVIPDTVKVIEEYAFTDCYNLTSITIPANVTHIGGDAFGFTEGTYYFQGDAPKGTVTEYDEILHRASGTAYYPAGNDTWTKDVMNAYHDDGDITWVPYEVEDSGISAPEITASNVASSGKIKLKWDTVKGAAKYEVYRSTSKNGTYKLMYTTEGTSYTNTSTKAGTYYYYYVVAVAKDGTESEKSNIVGRTCDLARPAVTLSNISSSGKIKVSWTAVDGAVKYEVYRATSKNGTYTKLITTTKTSINNTSATAGKTYYYKVKAIAEKSAANSAYSSVKSRTCDLARPEVTLSLNSKDKPVVSWKAVTGAVKYKVYIYDSDGDLVKTVTTKNLKYTYTAAKSGKTYSFRVVAVHSSSSANSAKSTAVKIKSK